MPYRHSLLNTHQPSMVFCCDFCLCKYYSWEIVAFICTFDLVAPYDLLMHRCSLYWACSCAIAVPRNTCSETSCNMFPFLNPHTWHFSQFCVSHILRLQPKFNIWTALPCSFNVEYGVECVSAIMLIYGFMNCQKLPSGWSSMYAFYVVYGCT